MGAVALIFLPCSREVRLKVQKRADSWGDQASTGGGGGFLGQETGGGGSTKRIAARDKGPREKVGAPEKEWARKGGITFRAMEKNRVGGAAKVGGGDHYGKFLSRRVWELSMVR